MITTGIIKEINLSSGEHKNNKYKVELNLFQIPGDTKSSTYTYQANCMVPNGFSAMYAVGDKVYVGFLHEDKSLPIILGKIYQGISEEPRGSAFLEDLTVRNSVTLPKNIKIGDYSYSDLDNKLKSLDVNEYAKKSYVVEEIEKLQLHAAENVTPIGLGGTGATNAAEALVNLGAEPAFDVLPITKGGTAATNVEGIVANINNQVNLLDTTAFSNQLPDTSGYLLNASGGTALIPIYITEPGYYVFKLSLEHRENLVENFWQVFLYDDSDTFLKLLSNTSLATESLYSFYLDLETVSKLSHVRIFITIPYANFGFDTCQIMVNKSDVPASYCDFGGGKIIRDDRFNSALSIISSEIANLKTSKMNANPNSIELNADGNLEGYGGFIDFHFNGSEIDYTSRIIETEAGTLNIPNNLHINGNLTIEGNLTPASITLPAPTPINPAESLLVSKKLPGQGYYYFSVPDLYCEKLIYWDGISSINIYISDKNIQVDTDHTYKSFTYGILYSAAEDVSKGNDFQLLSAGGELVTFTVVNRGYSSTLLGGYEITLKTVMREASDLVIGIHKDDANEGVISISGSINQLDYQTVLSEKTAEDSDASNLYPSWSLVNTSYSHDGAIDYITGNVSMIK